MATSPPPAETVVSVLLLLVVLLCGGCRGGAPPPAMYVFGDSLADVGNNNHLRLSLLRADYPHNGVDFAERKATGRFSNGKNAADFFGTSHTLLDLKTITNSNCYLNVAAEKLGLAASPAYLSLPSDPDDATAFLTGVNFASGGAGTLSNSIFLVVIGSNDIFHYVRSSSGDKLKNPPEQFIESMVSSTASARTSLCSLALHQSGAARRSGIATRPATVTGKPISSRRSSTRPPARCCSNSKQS